MEPYNLRKRTGLNRTRQAERGLKNGVKYPCTTVKIT